MKDDEMPEVETMLQTKWNLEEIICRGGCDKSTLTSYVHLLAQIDREFVGIMDFRWEGPSKLRSDFSSQ
jgi:hypothetical protein